MWCLFPNAPTSKDYHKTRKMANYWTNPLTQTGTWYGQVNSTKGKLSYGTGDARRDFDAWDNTMAIAAYNDMMSNQTNSDNWRADHAKITARYNQALADQKADANLRKQEDMMGAQVDAYKQMVEQMKASQEIQLVEPMKNVDAAMDAARDDALARRKRAAGINSMFAMSRFGAGNTQMGVA